MTYTSGNFRNFYSGTVKGIRTEGSSFQKSPHSSLIKSMQDRARAPRRMSMSMKMGIGTMAGIGTTIGAMKLYGWAERSRQRFLGALYPGTSYTGAGGSLGLRAGSSGPAGIDGLKFSFSRRNG